MPRRMPKAVHISEGEQVNYMVVVSRLQARGQKRTPAHDKSAANSGGRVLSGVDGHGGSLCAHADTQEDAAHQKLRPCLRTGCAEDRPEAEVGSSEDGSYDQAVSTKRENSTETCLAHSRLTTAAKIEVEGI